jgi:hypothetical protein
MTGRLAIRIGAWLSLSLLGFYGLLAALQPRGTWLDWLNVSASIAVCAVIYQVALRHSSAARERVTLP